jgi:chloramphenicol 3-O phosphotransferase
MIMERRMETWHAGYSEEGKVPSPVRLWQELVHVPGMYDLEVDTSLNSPEEGAKFIYHRLEYGPPPTAFKHLQNLEAK